MVKHCTENFCKHTCLVNMALLLSFVIVAMVQAVQAFGSKTYRGAVVEFAPPYPINAKVDPQYTMLQNAKTFTTLIEIAATEKVDIIVFPEYGLTGWNLVPEGYKPEVSERSYREKVKRACVFVPDPEDNSIPCTEKPGKIAELLRELSCAARNNKIYVVTNLSEMKSCDTETDGCPYDGLYLYNTNIVFDRHGKIIAKFHKHNLFLEPQFNVSKETVTFDTDFGVKFGTFICFDMLFPEPATKEVMEKHVRNFVYSTAWVAELPMVMATPAQAGYSYSHNVNFLASGLNYLGGGSAGSGIYSGKNGPLVLVMPEEETIKLLIADIPVDPDIDTSISIPRCNTRTKECSSNNTKILTFSKPWFKAKKTLEIVREDLSVYDNSLLEEQLDVSDIKSELIEDYRRKTIFSYKNEDGFECEITVKWDKNPRKIENKPVYRLFGYSGHKNYKELIWGIKIEACFLLACSNSSVESCASRPTFTKALYTNIRSIDIKTKSLDLSAIPFPITVDEHLLPLFPNELTYSRSALNDTSTEVAYMHLEKPRKNLISFGTYKSRWAKT